MEFAEYTTKDGDRIDTIALNAYGNSHQNWKVIFDANPQLPILDEYEGGIKINIPVLSSATTNLLNSQSLPPWKR